MYTYTGIYVYLVLSSYIFLDDSSVRGERGVHVMRGRARTLYREYPSNISSNQV